MGSNGSTGQSWLIQLSLIILDWDTFLSQVKKIRRNDINLLFLILKIVVVLLRNEELVLSGTEEGNLNASRRVLFLWFVLNVFQCFEFVFYSFINSNLRKGGKKDS